MRKRRKVLKALNGGGLLTFRACRTISTGLKHVLRHQLSKHVTKEPKHLARPRCLFEQKGACSKSSMLVRAHLLCADSLFPKLLFVCLSICSFEHFKLVSPSIYIKIFELRLSLQTNILYNTFHFVVHSNKEFISIHKRYTINIILYL